jgi:urease accessory protein
MLAVAEREVGTPVLGELRAPASESWRGRLSLRLERRGERTLVTHREHVGPLVVQRPFHPERDGTCHVYVLHPPGGVVGGDVLELDIEVSPRASALLTTPAATKLYRTAGKTARLRQRLSVRAGAALEWLPQETIAFGGTYAKSATEVVLEPGGAFMGWEITCLGRPASGDAFESGTLEQSFTLVQAGRPVLVDRLCTEGGGSLARGVWGWGGRTVYGCFIAANAPPELARRVREEVRAAAAEELFAVTHVGGACVCRYLGTSAERARACLGRAWHHAREVLFGKAACPPRIWAT